MSDSLNLWYFKDSKTGFQQGPVDFNTLKTLEKSGRFSDTAVARLEGTGNWVPMTDVRPLAETSVPDRQVSSALYGRDKVKIKYLYAITIACFVLSVLLTIKIHKYHFVMHQVYKGNYSNVQSFYSLDQKEDLYEKLEIIAVLLYSISAILISASLTLFTKKYIRNDIYELLIILLFGLTSSIIYWTLFWLAGINAIGRGEQGLVFLVVLGYGAPVAIGFLSILVNFIVLFKNLNNKE